MKKNRIFTFFSSRWFLFGAVVVVAVGLRFYQLGNVPHGMTWDEAAIGYNGYAVLHTRRDEWLERLPVSFRSFGDYKAPLAIYINGISTLLFGMNLWGVRFPFAIAGVFAVCGMMLLTHRLLFEYSSTSEKNRWYLALTSGILLAFSPWHLHFSRAGFESGLSLAFLIWGTLFLYEYFSAWQLEKQNFLKKTFLLFLSTTCFIASMYSYHSAKIVAPVLAIWMVLSQLKKIWHSVGIKKRKYLFFSLLLNGIIAVILLWPMFLDSFYGKGLARSGTLIFSQKLAFSQTLLLIARNFWTHLSPRFLVFGETTSLRHGDGTWGVLFPISYILIIFTLVKRFFFKLVSKRHGGGISHRFFLLAALWILVGILPASFGSEVPHSNRAFLALPGFILLGVQGVFDALETLHENILGWKQGALKMKSIIGTIILIHALCIVAYLGNYYTSFAAGSAKAFNDGYLEAFSFVIPYEKDLVENRKIEKILFTSEYGQPYIYALFSRKTNPIWYQGGSLIKYEFTDTITEGDLQRKNAVIVAGKESNLATERADYLVYGSDGDIRFKIYITDHE